MAREKPPAHAFMYSKHRTLSKHRERNRNIVSPGSTKGPVDIPQARGSQANGCGTGSSSQKARAPAHRSPLAHGSEHAIKSHQLPVARWRDSTFRLLPPKASSHQDCEKNDSHSPIFISYLSYFPTTIIPSFRRQHFAAGIWFKSMSLPPPPPPQLHPPWTVPLSIRHNAHRDEHRCLALIDL